MADAASSQKNLLEVWHVAWKGRRPLSWLSASREDKERRAHRSTTLGPRRGGGSRGHIGPTEIVLTSCPPKPYWEVQTQVADRRRVPRAPGQQLPFPTGPTCHSGAPSLGCFALVPITLPRTEEQEPRAAGPVERHLGEQWGALSSAAHTQPDAQQLPQCSVATLPCKRGRPDPHAGTLSPGSTGAAPHM